MAFCSNCGTKLENTDPFCYACGAQQKSTAGASGGGDVYQPVQGGQAQGINNDLLKKYFNEIFIVAKGMILAPVSTIKNLSKNTYKESSYILAGIIALLQALFVMWAVAQAVGSIMGNTFGRMLKIPYGEIFLIYLLAFIVVEALLLFGLYLMGKYVFKGALNLLSAWNIIVAAAVPLTASIFLGILLNYINGTIGQVVILFGILISVFCIYSGTREGSNLSDDKNAFLVAVVFIITFLVFSLVIGAVVKAQLGNLSGNILNGLLR